VRKLAGKPYSWRDWLGALILTHILIAVVSRFDPDKMYLVIIISLNVGVIGLVKTASARRKQKEGVEATKKMAAMENSIDPSL